MNAIDIEKLNQLISRTDISGNDKVRWLTDFIDGRELQLIQDEFYSEEEVNNIFYAICKHSFFEDNVETVYLQDVKDEFEQFKKK